MRLNVQLGVGCHKVIGSVFVGKSVALFWYINAMLVHCILTFSFSHFSI